jgi:tetratricopeptide (TPR) repeat protein
MRRALVALALATLDPASAAARANAGRAEGSSSTALFARAMNLLADEEVEEAGAILEGPLAATPDDPGLQLAAGVLRLHQQRYGEAVELLEAAERQRPGIGGDYLELARKSREVTRGYLRFEGEHFTVSYPKGKEEVLVPYLLEALEAQRAALAKDLGRVPPGKVTVELLEGTRALARVSTLTEQEIKTSGTIAICKFNKLMMVSPKALLRGYDWLDTAAHEYVHYVVSRRTNNHAPIWLHEGLAKWEETRWRGPAGEALSPFSAALLRDAARRGKLISFAEMHPSMAKLPSQEAAALAFAEVAVAVEYLHRRGGDALLNRILDLVAGGAGAEEAVARALSVPFESFLADWRRYLAARPLPEGGETELRRMRFAGDPKHGGTHSEWAEIPDEPARGHARLGEIFRERGRWEAARTEYGKAVKRVGARHPVLADKFALASMMAGRDAEAEAALSEALARHPGYAALNVHLGRLYLKRREWPRAREALLRANRTDPFDPEIHAGLFRAYEALGDGASASRERRFAEILSGHGK